MEGLNFFDSFWTETYQNLNRLMAVDRPDFIFADFLDQAGIDMMNKWQIPLAVSYIQTPFWMAPQSYIPGLPGMQQRCQTSEHASLWDRFYEEFWSLWFLFSLKDMIVPRRKMRKEAGAPSFRLMRKPNYLALVNSCFGVEVPKDLPPSIVPVGPILGPDWAPLTELEPFLETHKKVVYLAFGTHIILPAWRLERIVEGLTYAIRAGYLDGVIWAMKSTRADLQGLNMHATLDFKSILTGKTPDWKIVSWAPQRAILDHPSTCLFLTQCGNMSMMEALYHGVPILALPSWGDHIPNAKRVESAGVGMQMDRNKFTVNELLEKTRKITQDVDGSFLRNVLRLQRLVSVASRRKSLAADKIEEVMYDHELRFEHSPHEKEWNPRAGDFSAVGNEIRPLHLQTADSRMSWFRSSNADMWLASAIGLTLCTFGSWYTVDVLRAWYTRGGFSSGGW